MPFDKRKWSTVLIRTDATDTETRELTADELYFVAGGSPLDIVINLWNAGTAIPLQCEQDPAGTGTTIGNCMYF